MNYPYERYIVYRALRGDTLQEVNSKLTNLCLPLVAKDDWSLIEDQILLLYMPVGYKGIFNKRAKDAVPQKAVEFLKLHGFDQMFAYEAPLVGYLTDEGSRAMEGAFDIHTQPFTRLAVNVLLLHRRPRKEIEELVERGHGLKVNTQTIDIYEQFFFNTAKMRNQDWTNLLEGMAYKEKEIMYAGLTQKLEEIKFLIKIPTSIEYAEFLKRTLEIASYKVNYFSALNTENSDKQARSWAVTGIVAGEKYSKYSRQDSGDMFKTLQMEFAFSDDQIEGVDQSIADSLVASQNSDEYKKRSAEIAAKRDPKPEPMLATDPTNTFPEQN